MLELKVETKEPGRANTAGEGIRYAPYGLLGGKDGLPHRYRLLSNGKARVLKTKEVGIPVMPGDVFFIESAGGGGYGEPSEREPESRKADLENGFVTRQNGARRARPRRRQKRSRRR